MCRFCVEHGEGERWYLNAQNYAFDLANDLDRRRYMTRFVADFEQNRATALDWAERLDRMPAPLSRTGKAAISHHMQKNHFGQPVPLEECERILELCTSLTVIPCICRMHTPGKKAEEVCLLVTTQPVESILQNGFEDYVDGPDLSDFNRVTRDQAMELLRESEQRGLMHSIWTFQTPFAAAICNCNLESGCMAMKLTAGHGVKLMWRGEWVASVDDDRCTGCGRCVRICPFSAIAKNGAAAVRAEACWGCGICRSSCPEGALRLIDRHEVPAVANLW